MFYTPREHPIFSAADPRNREITAAQSSTITAHRRREFRAMVKVAVKWNKRVFADVEVTPTVADFKAKLQELTVRESAARGRHSSRRNKQRLFVCLSSILHLHTPYSLHCRCYDSSIWRAREAPGDTPELYLVIADNTHFLRSTFSSKGVNASKLLLGRCHATARTSCFSDPSSAFL